MHAFLVHSFSTSVPVSAKMVRKARGTYGLQQFWDMSRLLLSFDTRSLKQNPLLLRNARNFLVLVKAFMENNSCLEPSLLCMLYSPSCRYPRGSGFSPGRPLPHWIS